MASKGPGDQCSKPAGTGSSDLTAKKGIAITEINHSFFISHHLETSSGFPLGIGILIWLSPQNNKNRAALLEKAPRRFFLRLGVRRKLSLPSVQHAAPRPDRHAKCRKQ